MVSGFSDAIPVTEYSPTVFEAIEESDQGEFLYYKLIQVETGVVARSQLWGPRLWVLDRNVSLSSSLEPFDKGFFSHGSASAYPPDRSRAILPTALDVVWSNSSLDDTAAFVLRNITDTVHDVALADGQNVSHAAKYPNYALFGTPLEDMYGGNVERLRKIRAAVDPEDVMGLAGGWKF